MKNKVQYKRTRELLGYYFIVFSFIFLFGPYQASKSGKTAGGYTRLLLPSRGT